MFKTNVFAKTHWLTVLLFSARWDIVWIKLPLITLILFKILQCFLSTCFYDVSDLLNALIHLMLATIFSSHLIILLIFIWLLCGQFIMDSENYFPDSLNLLWRVLSILKTKINTCLPCLTFYTMQILWALCHLQDSFNYDAVINHSGFKRFCTSEKNFDFRILFDIPHFRWG